MAVDQKATLGALVGVQVLVVEDDEDSLSAMQVNLEQAGAVVIGIATVSAALKALAQYTPDVILTDLKMPDADGVSFVRELRLITVMRGVPVLAVTGFPKSYDLRDLFEVGFIGVMRKPVDYPELIRTVGTLARARRHPH